MAAWHVDGVRLTAGGHTTLSASKTQVNAALLAAQTPRAINGPQQ
jgi:hypothetical protein